MRRVKFEMVVCEFDIYYSLDNY